jgi:hypothetical protein
VSERAVFGVVVEFSLKLFVSLLNVDADTDGDEQKCTGDDQNDNKRAAFIGRGLRLVGNDITRLVSDLPVVSIEADVLVVGVSVVQHHVVVAEKGVSDDVSLVWGSILTVDEELAGVIVQSLVVRSKNWVWELPVNSIIILIQGQNVLSKVFICLFIRFGSVEI